MSRVAAASTHQALNIVLVACLAALTSLYLQLRGQYSELQVLCVQHAGYREQTSPSCVIACSDYCKNLARTEHKQVQSSSELSVSAFTHSLNQVETDGDSEKAKLENILPSYPAVFKTFDPRSSHQAGPGSEASTEPDKSHFVPSSSSLIPESYSDLSLRSPKLKMTVTESDDERLNSEFLNTDGHFSHIEASSIVPTEESIHSVGYLNKKMSSFWMQHGKTDSPPSTRHHEEDFRLDTSSYSLFRTDLPFLETSSAEMSSGASSASKFLFYQDLDSTERLTDHKMQAEDIFVTGDRSVPQDSCETEICPARQATNWEFLLYDDTLEKIDDDYFTNGGIPEPSSFVSLSTFEFTNQFFGTKAVLADLHELSSRGTSMSCESVGESELCQFENLCYNTRERDFVFLVGGDSVEASLDQAHSFTLNLSAVADHNAHTYPLVFLPVESLNLLSVALVEDPAFIMSRFKPDNLMHVLHDDLLPLVHTLYHLKHIEHHGKTDLRLVMADSFDPRDNLLLYTSIFSHPPLWLFDSPESTDLICFTDSYTGVSTQTVWYQYGFFKPQGPVMKNTSQLIRNARQAASHIAYALQAPCLFCKGDYLVIMSRKENRLILNEGELILKLVQTLQLKVLSVSAETHSIQEIISIVKNSKGLLGMHGSLLVFGVFLPPGSIFIELFPYGVNPEKYTPFKTFCDLPQSGIVYKSWQNTDSSKTVGHPERSRDLGGLRHLTPARQAEILAQTEVPDHLCCEDPSWLYHIYQDTQVDVDIVVNMTKLAITFAASPHFLQDLHNFSSESAEPIVQSNKKFYLRNEAHREKHKDNHLEPEESHLILRKNVILPSRVRHLSCQLTASSTESDGESISDLPFFLLTWTMPWNLQFVEFSKLNYEIVYQADGAATGVNQPVASDHLQYIIQPGTLEIQYFVWVRAVLDESKAGPYQFVLCQKS